MLNQALEADPDAINELMNKSVEVNKALADHPTIQVGKWGGKLRLRPLGLINGLFGVMEDGWGHIAMTVELGEPDRIVEFKRVTEELKRDDG